MNKGLEALKKVKWKLEDEGILGEEYELCDVIEKSLKALEIIKKFVWIEDDEIHLGLYGDSEIVLRKNDFDNKDEYELLRDALL